MKIKLNYIPTEYYATDDCLWIDDGYTLLFLCEHVDYFNDAHEDIRCLNCDAVNDGEIAEEGGIEPILDGWQRWNGKKYINETIYGLEYKEG